MSMNVPQATVAVNKFVIMSLDPSLVAVKMDTIWRPMDSTAVVCCIKSLLCLIHVLLQSSGPTFSFVKILSDCTSLPPSLLPSFFHFCIPFVCFLLSICVLFCSNLIKVMFWLNFRVNKSLRVPHRLLRVHCGLLKIPKRLDYAPPSLVSCNEMFQTLQAQDKKQL